MAIAVIDCGFSQICPRAGHCSKTLMSVDAHTPVYGYHSDTCICQHITLHEPYHGRDGTGRHGIQVFDVLMVLSSDWDIEMYGVVAVIFMQI